MLDINQLNTTSDEKEIIKLYQELKKYADRIEDIRIELFNNSIMKINEEERSQLSDLLFSIQSKLRFDVKILLDCVVFLED